jgi:hypothetical protein
VRISQPQLLGLFQLVNCIAGNVEAVKQLVVQAALLQIELGQLVATVLVPEKK